MDRETIKQLHLWYQKQPGKSLLLREKEILAKQLSCMRGEQIVFMGDWLLPTDFNDIHFQQQLVLTPAACSTTSDEFLIQAAFEQLPIASNSVDVVIIPHILDFCHRPGDVLKEAYRILAPEGYIVLMTFNPFSWWNVCRQLHLKKYRKQIPWLEPYIYYSANTLAEFKFLLIERQTYYFLPPFKSEKLLNKAKFLENLGLFCAPALGNSVFTLAQKRVNLARALPIKEEKTAVNAVPSI